MIEKNDADMVISGYIKANSLGNKKCFVESRTVEFNKKNRQKEMYKIFFESYGSSICSKIYLKDKIKDLKLKKIKIGEDMLFNIEYINKCKRVYISDYTGYYYLENEKSATNNLISDILIDLNDILKTMNKTEIINCYVYRIYGEYISNCYKFNKKSLLRQIRQIKDYDEIQKIFSDKETNKIVAQYMKNKRIYIKLVSFFMRNKMFTMLYLLEIMKFEIKKGVKQ